MVYKTNESLIVIKAEAIRPNKTDVVFWSHDRGTAKLRMKLVRKDGISQSLPEGTTVPIRLMFRSATAEGGYGKHDYLATIEDRVNGIVSIVLEDNILGYVGIVEGSVYIDFPNDRSLDTAGRFTFSIKRSPIDDSTPELENYYFNGFSQTIDKIEQMVSNAKTEIDTKVADTKKEFDTDVEKIQTSIGEAKQSLTTLNGDMTALEEKIAEADQHFVNKESVEAGPLIFKNTTITTQDWNDITESGIYYCAASSGINAPHTGKLYGFLTVYSEQAVTVQKYEFQNSIYMRTFAGNPAAWGAWRKIAVSSEVMNLTEPQTVGGTKDFLDPPLVNGKAILYGDQLFEGFYGSGTVHSNFKNKARVAVGGLVMDGQPRLSEPFEWNTGRWMATVTRDVTFYCKGTMYIDTGGSMGKYIYIANWKDEAQTQYASGNPAGMGIAADNGYWYRNFCDFSFIASLKKGDKFSIGIELAEGKEVWNIQIRTLQIKELVPPTQ
ncbi:MAG: phage baseplate upper protein [Leuconostoc sp.]|nr:phage baseplate upper protein [Leuconostoc sp.]